MAKKTSNKKPSKKRTDDTVGTYERWVVRSGKLVPKPGRPSHTKSLFSYVAEKIPFEALGDTRKKFKDEQRRTDGVYIAHDSMGYARYVGRGNVFTRLQARKREAPLELHYFSFYIVANKKHEREVETVMIRLGGPHLHFNSRKKRVDINPGNILDYEPGTFFIERQKRKGRKASK